jgi:hypothetical protein
MISENAKNNALAAEKLLAKITRTQFARNVWENNISTITGKTDNQ